MMFVSGYRMIFNLLKLEQINNSIYVIQWCCHHKLLYFQKMMEYDQEMYYHRLQVNPLHFEEGTQSRHNPTLTVQYICIFQVPIPFNVNKLCSDRTKICLDIGQAY